MSEDDILKLKSAFLYILNKEGTLDIFRLSKTLYFADRQHMVKYGRRIINDTFFAMEYGPVPSNIYDIFKYKKGDSRYCKKNLKTIACSFRVGSDDASNQLFPIEMPDMDELSPSDIECLDESFDAHAHGKFRELSSKSHDDAWKKAYKKKSSNPINYLDMAKAGGASDELIEFIKENTEIANCLS